MSADESGFTSREEFIRREFGEIQFTWERAPKLDAVACMGVGIAAFSATIAVFTFFPELDRQTFSGAVDYVSDIQSRIREPFEKIIMALE